MNGNKKEYHNGSLTIEEKEQNIYAVENDRFKLEGEVIVQENGEIFLRLLRYKKKDSRGYLINARRMKEQRAAWLLYILSEYGYIPKPTITITDYNSLNKDL